MQTRTDHHNIPRWPPVEHGLPVVEETELLASQRGTLIRLEHEVGEPSDLWQARYAPLVEHFARWVHLLPASRQHHHFGAGGLLRHALESAVAAAGLFDRVVVGQDRPTRERPTYRMGMRWAAVAGALLHDCAKPLTDLEVTGERTGAVWNPVQGSLVGWTRQAGERRYHLRWRRERAGAHRLGAAVMLPRIAGPALLAWLVETSGQEALLELIEAVMDAEQPSALASIIGEADRISVANDLARRNALNEDHRISGVAAERHILDAARALLQEGGWRAGGKVCAKGSDGSVLLAWPKAGRDIADWLTRHHLPGVVRSPEAIADVLLDTGVAERTSDGNSVWRLRTPEGVALTGLRLRSGNALDPLLEGVTGAGEWIEDKKAETTTEQTDSGSHKTPNTGESTAPPSEGNEGTKNIAASTVASATGSGDQPETSADTEVTQPWLTRIGECAVAVALAEDLANGAKPARLLFCDDAQRYLAYPDAFKGYGMAPLAAAKTLISAGLAEGEGNRIALDVEGAPFKKGVRLAGAAPPLVDPARAQEFISVWFDRQSGDDVREFGGRRYISYDNLGCWAALFGDPDEVIGTLTDDGAITLGDIEGTNYARRGPALSTSTPAAEREAK